jgi:hypothetical protein
VVRELARARGTAEELTPVHGDPAAAVPVAAVTAAMLAHPRFGGRVAGGAVANYALTPAAWQEIVSRA